MIKHSGLYYRASIYYFLALVNAFRLHIPYGLNNVMRFSFKYKKWNIETLNDR